MQKITALLYHVATIASLCHVTTEMSQFVILNGRRCDNTSRLLLPAFDTRHVLSCIATCRATTDCNSINFAPNAAGGLCELLQTSDFSQLNPDTEWNFYSTNLNSSTGIKPSALLILKLYTVTDAGRRGRDFIPIPPLLLQTHCCVHDVWILLHTNCQVQLKRYRVFLASFFPARYFLKKNIYLTFHTCLKQGQPNFHQLNLLFNFDG